MTKEESLGPVELKDDEDENENETAGEKRYTEVRFKESYNIIIEL